MRGGYIAFKKMAGHKNNIPQNMQQAEGKKEKKKR